VRSERGINNNKKYQNLILFIETSVLLKDFFLSPDVILTHSRNFIALSPQIKQVSSAVIMVIIEVSKTNELRF
jgi:hypothetical protein